MAKRERYPYDEYPILGVRVTSDVYGDMIGRLDEVVTAYNKKSPKHGKKKYKQNEIFVRALKRGLSQLKFELDKK